MSRVDEGLSMPSDKQKAHHLSAQGHLVRLVKSIVLKAEYPQDACAYAGWVLNTSIGSTLEPAF